jgi:murein L,D-transpeptidase YcbB/YkuD
LYFFNICCEKATLRRCFAALVLFLSVGDAAMADDGSTWRLDQIGQLRQWVEDSREDALPPPSTDRLDRALASGAAPGEAASELALRLARLHLLGATPPPLRGGWHIADPDTAVDLAALLKQALVSGSIDAFFSGLRPAHSDYQALRTALAREADPARRAMIARNMERWRWLPRTPGRDYLLVNAAAFDVRFWRSGAPAGQWRIIAGKPATPTPVFSTTVTGVILNPWWTVPASIVRERRGRFPAAQGYVRSGGQVRQRPGRGNALGAMKLDMPNQFSVYLHDTPNKALFAREARAFSHGCIRVDDAPGFAAALLAGTGTSRDRIDAVIASRRTTAIALAAPLPVYIAYFTAAPDETGEIRFYPDIYGREGAAPATTGGGAACGA